ncbi:MAG: membrane protein insertion efficiency factor YidD [Oligoflexia bacterium]|nr:membrane protein insertion efficiency factor YidD [Oligoflexia bacterium]
MVISPVLHLLAGPGYGCRFQPSCSEYSREAIRRFGPLRGSYLSIKRILRCNPFGGSGHDPLPQ